MWIREHCVQPHAKMLQYEDIMFYVTYDSTEQQTVNLQPGRFTEVRICGASHNWGVKLSPSCHSPGFISRKSGKDMTFLPPLRTQTGHWSRQREPQSQMRCGLTLFRLPSHTLSKDSIFWHRLWSRQQGVLFIWSPRVSKNPFVKMKPTDSFWSKYTPRGEPVNYVEPPTINVDMFTDLVHQHTRTQA